MKLLRALGYSLEEAVVELWRNRLVNLISIATIAVSLFILGIFLSIANLGNDGRMVARSSSRSISSQRRPRTEALRISSQSPEVESQYISRKPPSPSSSCFPGKGIPDLLKRAAPRSVIRAAFRAPSRCAPSPGGWCGQRLKADYDLWIERLSSIIELSQVLGLAVGAALVLASVFTIFNVIKLTVYGRQDEIGIMRLVGATHAYIRGPFLVEGILQGGLGGLLALGLLYLAHEFLLREALRSFQLLPAADWLRFVPPSTWLFIVVGGMLVGLLGSLLSVRKFLASNV
jgi:cell division transport system permease protein